MISLIHPSRQRPFPAFKAHESWMNNASKTIEIQHILSVDQDDPDLQHYQTVFKNSTVIIGANKNVVQACNHAAKYALGDIIVVMSDDFVSFPGWDIKLQEAFRERNDILLKTNDGTQPWIVTIPIMGADFYQANGYIYHPEYQHMFCDTDLTHKADLEKRLVFRMDLPFIHHHYSTGMSKKDAVNAKADSTWNQGQAVYLTRVKEKFGLPGHINVLNIHRPEGSGHINWLKNRLK